MKRRVKTPLSSTRSANKSRLIERIAELVKEKKLRA